MGGVKANIVPIVSKLFCSPSDEVVFVVRSRPRAVNGGGIVVLDPTNNPKIVFRVDGCGILGKKDELILKDDEGTALLLIRKKGGIVEALKIRNRWNGYSYNLRGSQDLVFCLKDPYSCVKKHSSIRVSIRSRKVSRKYEEFEIKGYFPDRACSIVELSTADEVAQIIGMKKEIEEVKGSSDMYNVIIKPGIDQAFIFGVIAILDYIYGGSTAC